MACTESKEPEDKSSKSHAGRGSGGEISFPLRALRQEVGAVTQAPLNNRGRE